MSTRCNIIIKDGHNRFYLYHHCDGYPEGVGADLKHFAKEGNWGKNCNGSAHRIANKLLKGIASPLYGQVDYGYELTTGLHGDIEYFYIVKLYSNADPDKCGCAIEAYRALWPSEYAEYADTMLAIDGQICAAVEIPETEDKEEAK